MKWCAWLRAKYSSVTTITIHSTTETAGDYQVEGAKRVAALNIGGSGTTSVVHIVGVA